MEKPSRYNNYMPSVIEMDGLEGMTTMNSMNAMSCMVGMNSMSCMCSMEHMKGGNNQMQ